MAQICIEFGATDFYNNSNTLYLSRTGWSRVGFDLNYENVAINLYKTRLTVDNICDVFKSYNIPEYFDFASVDVDGNDYWLLKAMLLNYTPRVIMVEINARFNLYDNRIMKYNESYNWDGHSWYGASAYAFKLLGEEYNYTLVHTYMDEAFLIHNDCLSDIDKNKPWESVYQQRIDIYNGTDTYINESMYLDI